MGYVRTAGMSTAARRARRRAMLVILALLAGLLLVFALSLAYVQGWLGTPGGGADDASSSTAVVAPAPALEPSSVTVNVYNATSTAGLAGRTGDAVRARGFTVGTVANDPEGADIPGVGVIRHGESGLAGAQLLLAQLPEGVELVDDGRQAASVDLVLGDGWQDLPAVDGNTTTGDTTTEDG